MRTARLGEVFKITSGGTPNRSHNEYYEGGKIPWVKTGDLKVKNLHQVNENITEQGMQNSSAKIFPKNTILIAMYGATIGACSILKIEAATNQACAALLPNEKVDTDYLYYYLMAIKPKLIDKGIGGGQPNISATILKDIEFPFPDLQTQKQIAQILEGADRARQQRKAANALTEQFFKSTFLYFFGDPVINKNKWQSFKLKDLFFAKPSLGTTTPVSASGELKIVRVGEIGNYDILSARCGHVNLSTTEKLRYNLIEGDVLLARAIGSLDHLGKASIVKKSNEDLVFDSHVMRLRFDQAKLNPIYFYFLLQSKGGRKMFLDITKRTAVQFNVNSTQISSFEIPTPPLPLQQQFASLVADAEILRQKQQQSERELEQLFQALLQQYFGESKTVMMEKEEPLSMAAEPEESYGN